MPRENFWKLANNRIASMCERYNISAEVHKGSTYNGISWSVTFWCGQKYLAELRAITSREFYEKVASFDYGMSSRTELNRIRNGEYDA